MEANEKTQTPQANIINKKEVKGILPKIRQKLLKTFTPIMAVGSILTNADKIAAKPQAEPKKSLGAGISTLLDEDKTITERYSLAESLLSQDPQKFEKIILDNLKNEMPIAVESPLSTALRKYLIKQITEGKLKDDVLSPYLKRLKDPKTNPVETIHLLRILGWPLTNQDTNQMGFSIVNEKLVLFNPKPVRISTNEIRSGKEITHLNSDQIVPLIIEKLGSDNEAVREAAFLQLVGLTAFSDKKENILSELKKIAQDEKNLTQKSEAQKIIDLFDKSKTEDKIVEEKKEIVKDEVKEEQDSQYNKLLELINNENNLERSDAIKKLIDLAGEQAVSDLAKLSETDKNIRFLLLNIIEGNMAISKETGNHEKDAQTEIAKKALISGIGALLKTNPKEAVKILNVMSIQRLGGFGQYIPELLDYSFSLPDPFQQQLLGNDIFRQMPEIERQNALNQAYQYLTNPDPDIKAKAMILLKSIALDKNEMMQIANANHVAAYTALNRNPDLDPQTKSILLSNLSPQNPKSKIFFEQNITDSNSEVRISCINGLAGAGDINKTVAFALDDSETDPAVRQRGLFLLTLNAQKYPSGSRQKNKSADILYQILDNNNQDGQTKGYALSMLSALEMPIEIGLKNKSPEVRINTIILLSPRVKDNYNLRSQFEDIAKNDQDEWVKSAAQSALDELTNPPYRGPLRE